MELTNFGSRAYVQPTYTELVLTLADEPGWSGRSLMTDGSADNDSPPPPTHTHTHTHTHNPGPPVPRGAPDHGPGHLRGPSVCNVTAGRAAEHRGGDLEEVMPEYILMLKQMYRNFYV